MPSQKGIDRGRERRGGGDHFSHDEIDIGVTVALIFGGQRMRAEEGRLDADIPLASERAGGAQHLEFVVGRQAVPRFDLDRRNPLGDQRIETG